MALRGSATTRPRGTITSATVSSPNPSAREAISLARGIDASRPCAASSTSCCSSSRDSRASVKVVLSPKSRSTQRSSWRSANHTSGRIERTRGTAAAARPERVAAPRRAAPATSAPARRAPATGTRPAATTTRQREPARRARPASRRGPCRRQLVGQRRTAERRRGGADHGDADLHRGQETLGVLLQRQQGARAAPPVGDELLQARLADGDDGDLGAGEDAVGEDEGEDDDQLGQRDTSRIRVWERRPSRPPWPPSSPLVSGPSGGSRYPSPGRRDRGPWSNDRPRRRRLGASPRPRRRQPRA